MGRTKSLTFTLLASSAILVSGTSFAQQTDSAEATDEAQSKLQQSVPTEAAEQTMMEDAVDSAVASSDQSAVSSAMDQMSDMADKATDTLVEETPEMSDQDMSVTDTSAEDASAGDTSAEDTSADDAEQKMATDPTPPMIEETTSEAAPGQPLTEPVPLEKVEAMQTEEQYADGYVNYKAAPDTGALETLFEQDMLEFDSEVNLAVRLNRIEKEIAKCQVVRNDVEKIIGDRPGSYSVDIGWVKVYQNCLVQRRNEMDRLLKKVNQRQAEIVTAAGDDGASRQWDMIARVNARYSEVRLHLNSEFKRQADFVEYYNTGVMIYEDDTPEKRRRWPWQRKK